MTVKMTEVKPVFICQLGRRRLYATHHHLRWGARGKIQTASQVITDLDKGEARKVRKALFARGFRNHAAAIRRPCGACGKRSSIIGDLCGPCNKQIPF